MTTRTTIHDVHGVMFQMIHRADPARGPEILSIRMLGPDYTVIGPDLRELFHHLAIVDREPALAPFQHTGSDAVRTATFMISHLLQEAE